MHRRPQSRHDLVVIAARHPTEAIDVCVFVRTASIRRTGNGPNRASASSTRGSCTAISIPPRVVLKLILQYGIRHIHNIHLITLKSILPYGIRHIHNIHLITSCCVGVGVRITCNEHSTDQHPTRRGSNSRRLQGSRHSTGESNTALRAWRLDPQSIKTMVSTRPENGIESVLTELIPSLVAHWERRAPSPPLSSWSTTTS